MNELDGTKIVNNKFSGKDTGFTVVGGLKDASHIRALAQSVDAVVPIIDIVSITFGSYQVG